MDLIGSEALSQVTHIMTTTLVITIYTAEMMATAHQVVRTVRQVIPMGSLATLTGLQAMDIRQMNRTMG